ncbi:MULTISPECIES: xylulokinase [Nocardiopsis]|uniref:Xylulose kinase n=1 Tax=Nocardiopsis sinuspersici TaxID=501010 RepID=A0A1V3BYR3_9ACTN|nr:MULTISPECIES: xylulokinase [Nocardiopsis]NYH54589.1 xylulokinase [Nocardiopsis sinuspersici]OOC53386.1 xylulokinase [Nocardiopsis sinuspersici]
MPLVAGVDSSTQSCKIVVCDADSGAVVREARAPHPDGTEVHPDAWWSALTQASSGLLDDVASIAVAGQQHGMVAVDELGSVVRPALLWNDTRSAGAALDLVEELGGPAEWAGAVDNIPNASLTVSKLRWLARHEPDHAARTTGVMLPHDWLTWRLTGAGAEPTTDRGDASGTGYWSATENAYRPDLLARAFGREIRVPRVAEPAEAVGRTPSGALVAPGTGDNMGAALGLGLRPGDAVVSLGTSGTVFAVSEGPTRDPSGIICGFADATGRYLPLVCTLNAARVLSATAAMLGVDLAGLDELALAAEPGAEGVVLLPYLDGERTPVLPDAAGSLHGLRRSNMRPENIARAAVEGMLCGLADGLAAMTDTGVPVNQVMLVGGAARSAAVRAVAPTVLGARVVVPPPAEYVALGAARQAAWTLAETAEPPAWGTGEPEAAADPVDVPHVRERYAEARRSTHGV